jgi:hypothetical protein
MEIEEWEERERKKWHAYEVEKRKLRKLQLLPLEYEHRLAMVVLRLGL